MTAHNEHSNNFKFMIFQLFIEMFIFTAGCCRNIESYSCSEAGVQTVVKKAAVVLRL